MKNFFRFHACTFDFFVLKSSNDQKRFHLQLKKKRLTLFSLSLNFCGFTLTKLIYQ